MHTTVSKFLEQQPPVGYVKRWPASPRTKKWAKQARVRLEKEKILICNHRCKNANCKHSRTYADNRGTKTSAAGSQSVP